MNLFVRKPEHEEAPEHAMHRHLGVWNLTFMGIGGTIGAGIFVLSGTVAANYAGPAVSLSYLVAALGCICAALCYAEFASMSASAGSAYLYAYRSLGEFPAWMIGWTLVLEYLFSAATVAVGWSGYLGALLGAFGVALPASIAQAPIAFSPQAGLHLSGALINLPAVSMTVLIGTILARGISLSASINVVLMAIKVGIILLVVLVGAGYVDPANWRPYIPANAGQFGIYGWSGVFRGAGVVFFAYVGFDMISTAAQESRNPKRDLPLSLLATLGACTLLYVAMALIITGLAPFHILGVASPITAAVDHVGPALAWLSPLVALAAVVGLASALMITMYGQTRIFLAMARDGLLSPSLARLHPTWRTPIRGTALVTAIVSLAAAVLPVQLLGELASIGTLLAFIVVAIGVMVLRRREPDAGRGFRLPGGDMIPVGAVLSCTALMATLPSDTWWRLLIWSAIGVAIYFVYGIKRSKLQNELR